MLDNAKFAVFVKDFTKFLIEEGIELSGKVAQCMAHMYHMAKLDNPVQQWGNAYFRCPDCGAARDCDGQELWDEWWQACCPECETDLDVENLRISEGWVERDVLGRTEG